MAKSLGPLLLALLSSRQRHVYAAARICAEGEVVTAFFAGEVDLGRGSEPCNPTMSECFFSATVASSPDAYGVYTVDWDDGDSMYRKVHASQLYQHSTGELCGESPRERGNSKAMQDRWTPPEIPCTVMPHLHWEGTDPAWNKNAINTLRAEFLPDEVIDGFDWHVIFRFHDVDQCEKAFQTITNVLKQCTDSEKCYAHPFVKAIEYVGDEPEARRKSGKHIHGQNQERGRNEL